MATDNYEEKYTRPALRRRLKEKIMQSDKGGKPGQWSARKSQLLVQEYEKQGGGYRREKKDAAARSLQEWTDQNWQTRDGSADADREEGMKRYLPEEAWALMTSSARRKAEKTKLKVDGQGDQVAEWPDIVRRTMVEIGAVDGNQGLTRDELYERARELQLTGRSDMTRDELKEAIVRAFRKENNLPALTRDELYQMARQLDISGRSGMKKDELVAAIRKAEE